MPCSGWGSVCCDQVRQGIGGNRLYRDLHRNGHPTTLRRRTYRGYHRDRYRSHVEADERGATRRGRCSCGSVEDDQLQGDDVQRCSEPSVGLRLYQRVLDAQVRTYLPVCLPAAKLHGPAWLYAVYPSPKECIHAGEASGGSYLGLCTTRDRHAASPGLQEALEAVSELRTRSAECAVQAHKCRGAGVYATRAAKVAGGAEKSGLEDIISTDWRLLSLQRQSRAPKAVSCNPPSR